MAFLFDFPLFPNIPPSFTPPFAEEAVTVKSLKPVFFRVQEFANVYVSLISPELNSK